MKKRSQTSRWMALLLVLSLLIPAGAVYAEGETETDKTDLLTTSLAVTVKQGGTEITGDTVPNADNLSIEVRFGVPVAGDYPNEDPVASPIIERGDTADIPLGTGFSLSAVSGGLPIALVTKTGITVGYITEFTSTDQGVTAHVEFGGEGTDVDFENDSGIEVGFQASLQINDDGEQDEDGNSFFQLLDKTYTIVPPVVPTTFEVAKSGTLDLKNECIHWTVTVTASQSGAGQVGASLKGYTFSDDLTDVGTYKEKSFRVGSSAETAGAPADGAGLSYADGLLTYDFPDDAVTPQTILFSTALTEAECFATSSWTKNNTAMLMKNVDEVTEGRGSVSFTPTWITKSGKANNETIPDTGAYDPQNQTITWTITANQMGATLPNAVITETLKNGLTLQSATWQTWQGSDAQGNDIWNDSKPLSDTIPTEPNPEETVYEFSLGTINTPVLLTIVTKVPNKDYIAEKTTYQNSASINWTGGPGGGIGTGNIGATIGYNAITKKGELDPKTGIITWTVTVDTRGQKIPDLKVYDLLVYGDRIDFSQVTGIPGELDSQDLTAQYHQKYVDDSFQVISQSDGSDLTLAKTPLTKASADAADLPAADLLAITGFLPDAPNTAEFTFRTQVIDPGTYAGNDSKSIQNTAELFSGNTKLNAATDSVTYNSHMLAKELLQRGADPTKVGQVNSQKTSNAKGGFDYVDKSVIFRLSVNADGMDLTNMPVDAQGKTMGNVTVTDTLPEGWEFDTINGNAFLIYEGESGPDKSVKATGDALTDPDFVTAAFDGATDDGKQKTAVFTFSALDKPYVILVKAKPTDETADEYFGKNGSTTVTNRLNLKSENWKPGVSVTRNVTVESTILSKTFDSSKAASQACLTWTVEYHPCDRDEKGTRVEDTLPEGIDLRTDASGNLVLTDQEGHANIAINELVLQADGSYAVGASVPPVPGTNVRYDSAGRVLTFQIPDSKQAYRFTYVTDITGNSGDIANQVKLYGSDAGEIDTDKSYRIVEQSGWATLNRGGSLTITKTNSGGTALPGAQFTLFASDGETVIRRGTVSEDGTLKMRAIPEGEYILRETGIPEGYLSEQLSSTPVDHAVTVAKSESGTSVITSIDEKTGADSNTITVKNYQSGTAGNLTIRKTVAGNAGDPDKAFVFTLDLTGASGTYNYVGSGVPDGTIQSGDTVSLAHGQSITVIGLPKDATYTVTEADYYSTDGYTTVSTGETGAIVADETQTAAFTNTRNVYQPGKSTGSLTISKAVAGAGADKAQAFAFTVTFTGAPGSYPYTGTNVSNGTIRSGDTVSLADGQSITITGLPDGAKYQVSEDAASARGYAAESTGSSGTISSAQDRTAAFTNTKLPEATASLTIRKTVTGSGGDRTRSFDFTVAFAGALDAYPYTGASSGTLRSGDTVSLADGQSITITGLPDGAEYTVTEADYTAEGYTTSSTESTGVLSVGTPRTASFVNDWSDAPGNSVNPGNPGTSGPSTEEIDDEDIPSGHLEGEDPAAPGADGSPNTPAGGAPVMPKTGISRAEAFARLGLLLFSASLAVLSAADFVARRRYTGKRLRK